MSYHLDCVCDCDRCGAIHSVAIGTHAAPTFAMPLPEGWSRYEAQSHDEAAFANTPRFALLCPGCTVGFRDWMRTPPSSEQPIIKPPEDIPPTAEQLPSG
jgi:hypothetical protein